MAGNEQKAFSSCLVSPGRGAFPVGNRIPHSGPGQALDSEDATICRCSARWFTSALLKTSRVSWWPMHCPGGDCFNPWGVRRRSRRDAGCPAARCYIP